MKYRCLASSATKACHVATVLLMISLSSSFVSAIMNTKTREPCKTARNALGNCQHQLREHQSAIITAMC